MSNTRLDRYPDRTPTRPRRSGGGLLLALLAIGTLAALMLFGSTLWERLHRGPRPETVVASSLLAVREQAVITPFVASFVTVPTSTQRRFGITTTQRTTILPATVAYEVDLANLRREDVRWDAEGQTLHVTLPPLRLGRPNFDLSRRRIYEDGEWLGAITGDNNTLDDANNAAAARDIIVQAQGDVPMRLAHDAARRVVGQMFEVPLKAAGLDARVQVAVSSPPVPPAR